ncbi:MAG TPA: aspartate ammonia-lyase, partial [Gammaproteobacteria bacterium]|nr:aspartate ammonia-lyase [Gammaproteobacteria bacterium]
GNFQLNVMLPMITNNLLNSITILAGAVRALDEKAVAGYTVNNKNLEKALHRNPILVTSLNSVIGYEKGYAIAKQAYAQGKPVLDVAEEMTDISRAELETLLDPGMLTDNKKKV